MSLSFETESATADTIVSPGNVPVSPGPTSIVTESVGQKTGQRPRDKSLIIHTCWFQHLQKREIDFSLSTPCSCDKEPNTLDKTKVPTTFCI